MILSQYKPIVCLKNFSNVIDQISILFNQQYQDIKYIKTLILHIAPELLEFLNDIVKLASNILIDQVVDIYYKILEYPIIVHSKLDLIQNKIFFEDNLAPKQMMATLQQNLSKQPQKFVERMIANIHELIKEPPNNKFKHILIKRHLLQLNTVLDSNIDFFCQFQELYEKIILTMRNNDQYLYFTETLNEDKSIYMIMAENYLSRAKTYLTSNAEGQLKILKTLQLVLPDKSVCENIQQQSKILNSENQLLQNSYIEEISQIYVNNPQLSNSSEFMEFIQKLYELSQYSKIAIHKLCILSENSKVLQYLLDASQKILQSSNSEQLNNDKKLIDLLNYLIQTKIPENSFISFISLDGQETSFGETSLLQSNIGHLFYLMPYLVQLIGHQQDDVRIKVQQVLSKISQLVVKID